MPGMFMLPPLSAAEYAARARALDTKQQQPRRRERAMMEAKEQARREARRRVRELRAPTSRLRLATRQNRAGRPIPNNFVQGPIAAAIERPSPRIAEASRVR